MFSNILIICLGNICRSPMVEAILKHRAETAKLSIKIHSAGIAALVGRPAQPYVQEILLEQNIDCSSHRARQLSSSMILESELIIVMEQFQRREIEYKFPMACGKVHCLGKWGEFEIPDPYKKPKEIFEETYRLIVHGIDQWQARLWN